MITLTTSRMVSAPLRRGYGRPGPDRRQWIIRPDDLLVLAFDLMNLQVKPLEGHDTLMLVKKEVSGSAYLIVWFPPQHILEKAYFTTVPNYPVAIPFASPDQPIGAKPKDPDEDNDKKGVVEELDAPPIDAVVAGWSRLVFYVPDDKLPIKWTLEGLLRAMRELEMSVPANALPPKQKRYHLRDVFAASVKQATSRASLAISPGALGRSTSTGCSRRPQGRLGWALHVSSRLREAGERCERSATRSVLRRSLAQQLRTSAWCTKKICLARGSRPFFSVQSPHHRRRLRPPSSYHSASSSRRTGSGRGFTVKGR